MNAISINRNNAIAASFVTLFLGAMHQSAQADTPMTAGLIMKEMPTKERAAYVAGIVEGMAYARFRYDSKKTGIAGWDTLWDGWESLQKQLQGYLAAKEMMAAGYNFSD